MPEDYPDLRSYRRDFRLFKESLRDDAAFLDPTQGSRPLDSAIRPHVEMVRNIPFALATNSCEGHFYTHETAAPSKGLQKGQAVVETGHLAIQLDGSPESIAFRKALRRLAKRYGGEVLSPDPHYARKRFTDRFEAFVTFIDTETRVKNYRESKDVLKLADAEELHAQQLQFREKLLGFLKRYEKK